MMFRGFLSLLAGNHFDGKRKFSFNITIATSFAGLCSVAAAV
jgi:hypothetical protein